MGRREAGDTEWTKRQWQLLLLLLPRVPVQLEALEVGKEMPGKRCGERRGRGQSGSSGSKCRNRRRSRLLGHFPGKMAVRLAAPLSLLPRPKERAA